MKVNKAKNHEIVCVIDKSGSMGIMHKEAIEGFNTFLQEQKEIPGDARISVILFNHEVHTLYEGSTLEDAYPLSEKTYVTEGMTALNDAIATAINTTEQRIEKENRKETTGVMVVVLTDGAENSSKEFRGVNSLKKLIETKQEAGWEFLFLSSDLNAQDYTQTVGLSSAYMAYSPTVRGLSDSYTKIGANVSRFRSQ